nr:MAG TPA: hypothetical protein [Caudoviricetes sp.]
MLSFVAIVVFVHSWETVDRTIRVNGSTDAACRLHLQRIDFISEKA